MTFLEKIKSPGFCTNVSKVAIPFFILVVVVSLFMYSWSDIFSGNFSAVIEIHFSDGKWIPFFGYKIGISVAYGLWMTAKNTK
jgi:hypothetical protein